MFNQEIELALIKSCLSECFDIWFQKRMLLFIFAPNLTCKARRIISSLTAEMVKACFFVFTSICNCVSASRAGFCSLHSWGASSLLVPGSVSVAIGWVMELWRDWKITVFLTSFTFGVQVHLFWFWWRFRCTGLTNFVCSFYTVSIKPFHLLGNII